MNSSKNLSIDPAAHAALFDIDGTLTDSSTSNVWHTLIHAPETPTLKRGWLYTTGLPHYLLSKTGVIRQAGFRDRWVRMMAWLMRGWPEAQVQALYQRTVTERLIPEIRSDVVRLLKQHSEAEQPVLLVSTMFEGMVEGFAAYLGAAGGVGSQVGFRNGICTGQIEGKTCSGGRKIEFVQRYLAQHYPDLSLEDCAGYADSASDIAFLAEVGLPTAVYPEDVMRVEAERRGWPVFEGE